MCRVYLPPVQAAGDWVLNTSQDLLIKPSAWHRDQLPTSTFNLAHETGRFFSFLPSRLYLPFFFFLNLHNALNMSLTGPATRIVFCLFFFS